MTPWFYAGSHNGIMQTPPTNVSPEEFEKLMDCLPMACRMFELKPDGRLFFVKANPAADDLFQRKHASISGLPMEEAFPELKESVIPRSYKEVLETGNNWRYQGGFFRQNGAFLGLFNVNVFRISSNRLASFSSPHDGQETEIIFHQKKMDVEKINISYPNVEPKKILSGDLHVDAIQNLRAPRIPVFDDQADDELNGLDFDFTDLFTINELEKIQDAFTNVTNVASIITLPDGQPITRTSNFCLLCDLIRQTPKGMANCVQSDALIGKPNPHGPTLRPCLSAGLWDGGASIIIAGKHVANWLVGQVRLSPKPNTDRLMHYAEEVGADPTQLVEAYESVPVMPFAEFYRVCHSLFLFANLISDMAYQNLRLVRAHMMQEQTAKALQASESRLQNLSSKLILTQEEERRQLAIELHDGIGQSLTAVKFSVDNILLNIDNPDLNIRDITKTASQIIKASIADVRRMQVELRPRILDELGIIATINWFCREFKSIYTHINLNINVDVEEEQVSPQLKPAVFRIIQEAFNNAAKYFEGDEISLSFTEKGGRLHLEIKDNGIGFDLDEVLSSRELNRGLGLDSMRERAELCNGVLEIISSEGQGATIKASWPAA